MAKNSFVQACVWGDLEQIKRRSSMGESVDQIDTGSISEPPEDPDDLEETVFQMTFQEPTEEDLNYFNDIDEGNVIHTDGLRGIHAAMLGKRTDSLNLLMELGADATLLTQSYRINGDEGDCAAEVAAASGFWQGIELLTEKWRKPLWPKTSGVADNLLISTIPHFNHTDFSQVSEAQKAKVPDLIRTFDYLVQFQSLSPRKAYYNGIPFVSLAVSPFAPLDYFEHVLKTGVDPNEEYVVRERPEILFRDAKSNARPTQEEIEEQRGLTFADVFGLINPGRKDQSERFQTTAFIDSSYEGDLERVLLMLRYGGDPLYEDRNGNNALKAAQEGLLDQKHGQHREIIAALEEKIRQSRPKPPGPIPGM